MISRIRKILIVFILSIVTFVAQNSLSVVSGNIVITPNLLVLLTCILGYIGGQKQGMIVGFISGLLVDVMAADIIGMNGLIYLYIGFISGIFHRLFYKDMILLPLAIVFGGDFLYNFGYYIFRFLLRNKLDFSFYMTEIILPEMIYTTFVAIFLHKVLYWIYLKWLVEEQRSTLNFD